MFWCVCSLQVRLLTSCERMNRYKSERTITPFKDSFSFFTSKCFISLSFYLVYVVKLQASVVYMTCDVDQLGKQPNRTHSNCSGNYLKSDEGSLLLANAGKIPQLIKINRDLNFFFEVQDSITATFSKHSQNNFKTSLKHYRRFWSFFLNLP